MNKQVPRRPYPVSAGESPAEIISPSQGGGEPA